MSSLTDQERAQLAYLESIAATEDAALFRAIVARFRPSRSNDGRRLHSEPGVAPGRGEAAA